MTIDLNLDAGESNAALNDGSEERLYQLVTSVNIACGGHTGDVETMTKAVRLAKQYNLAIGAHPSFPDRPGFGRRPMQIKATDLVASLKQQILDLQEICDHHQAQLTHVKPHGALYNLAAENRGTCDSLIEAVLAIDSSLRIVMLAGSSSVGWIQSAGLQTLQEAFVDRRYQSDGSLRPRTFSDALIERPQEAAQQALEIVSDANKHVDTLCIHGDSPKALSVAQTVRKALELHLVKIKAANNYLTSNN